jgi:hypothetical protein
MQYFCAMYNLPKNKIQELAKLKGREANYAKHRAHDQDKIVIFKMCI